MTRRFMVRTICFSAAVVLVSGAATLPFWLRVAVMLGFGLGFCFLAEAGLVTVEEYQRRRAPRSPVSTLGLEINPFDEHDTFATCPNPDCRILDDHHVQVIMWTNEVSPGPRDHESIVRSISDPPDGTLRARRRCRHCGHIWYTHAQQHRRST